MSNEENFCVVVDTKDGRSWHFCDELWKAIEEARREAEKDTVKHVKITLMFK